MLNMFITAKVMFQMSCFDTKHPKDIFYSDLNTDANNPHTEEAGVRKCLTKKKNCIKKKTNQKSKELLIIFLLLDIN